MSTKIFYGIFANETDLHELAIKAVITLFFVNPIVWVDKVRVNSIEKVGHPNLCCLELII